MNIFDGESEAAFAPQFLRNAATLIGIVVLHGIVFVAVSRIPAQRFDESEEFVGTVFFIEPRRKKEDAPDAKPRTPPSPLRPEKTSAPKSASELVRPTAITLPPVDWAAERARVAELQVNRGGAEREQRSLISKPKVMELPKKSEFKEHKRGDTERFDDGEIRTWINDNCYATNLPPPTPRLDPNAINVQCRIKGRPPIVDGFDHVKPNYLRKEGEAPAKPKSLFTGETMTCDYSSTVCDPEPEPVTN